MPDTTTCAISYKNLASVVTATLGTWEANAPLSNVLSPQLGKLAISNASEIKEFIVDVSDQSPSPSATVGLIALLNHNIISVSAVTDFRIFVYTEDGSVYNSLTWYEQNGASFLELNPSDGVFQSHAIWVCDEQHPDLKTKKVKYVKFYLRAQPGRMVCGSIDPYTGIVTEEPLKIGGVWVGPRFSPENGFALDSFAQGVNDRSQVIDSIGGQRYAEPEVRQRTASLTFGGLRESEVYALSPAQSMQQWSAYCGVSRPFIFVPTKIDGVTMYLQSLYAYFTQPPRWTAINRSGSERIYTCQIEMVEAK